MYKLEQNHIDRFQQELPVLPVKQVSKANQAAAAAAFLLPLKYQPVK